MRTCHRNSKNATQILPQFVRQNPKYRQAQKSCDIHASWPHTHSAYERVRARFVDHHGPAAKDGFHLLAVSIEAKFKEVGQHEIGKGGAVALELIRAFDEIQLCSSVGLLASM
jgi:hypothetical protein